MNNILIFGMTENPGGVESFLMSYIRKINRGNFKFDFLCNSHDKIAYEDELISMAVRFIISQQEVRIIRSIKERCSNFLKKMLLSMILYGLMYAVWQILII